MQKKNERITYIAEQRVPLSPHKYFYVVSFFCFRLMIKCLVFRLNISQKYILHYGMLQIDTFGEPKEDRENVRFLLLLSGCVFIWMFRFLFWSTNSPPQQLLRFNYATLAAAFAAAPLTGNLNVCIHKCGNKKNMYSHFSIDFIRFPIRSNLFSSRPAYDNLNRPEKKIIFLLFSYLNIFEFRLHPLRSSEYDAIHFLHIIIQIWAQQYFDNFLPSLTRWYCIEIFILFRYF